MLAEVPPTITKSVGPTALPGQVHLICGVAGVEACTDFSCLLLIGEMLGYPKTDIAGTSPPAGWIGLTFVALSGFTHMGRGMGCWG